MKHFLLTVPLAGANLHGYVMTNDKRCVAAVLQKMIDEVVPQTGRAMTLPMVLETDLGDEAATVRDILLADPRVRESLLAAKDFHFSVFMTSDPEVDRALMELH